MVVFAVGAAGTAALLAWGFAGLPSFGDFNGRYGTLLSHVAVMQRTASEVVATTTFDYRGLDTLGEELILFTAAVGVLTLLRIQRGEEDVAAESPGERGPVTGSRTMRWLGPALVGPVLVLGLYVITHGHLTPGGGFQGGVVLATALLAGYLGGAHLSIGRARPVSAMEVSEALGAGGFLLIGLGGVVFAGWFLRNFLPFGSFGSLISGGTIPLSNLAVGIEVMGATLLVLAELLDQRLLHKEGRR
jgi:multicomponent Na+:H+ antiporter subunit B